MAYVDTVLRLSWQIMLIVVVVGATIRRAPAMPHPAPLTAARPSLISALRPEASVCATVTAIAITIITAVEKSDSVNSENRPIQIQLMRGSSRTVLSLSRKTSTGVCPQLPLDVGSQVCRAIEWGALSGKSDQTQPISKIQSSSFK